MLLSGFLRVEAVNRLVFRSRLIYYVYLSRSIRVCPDQQAVISSEYSSHMLKRGVTSDRPLRLIRPLSVIDKLDKASASVLSIGCRFETELLYLRGYGFKNVRGMDLISYSPWVDIANMHEMPYPLDSWDVVLLGWVLSYSNAPEKAASEILRVTKNGGIVGIAVSYYPKKQLDEMERQGTLIGRNTGRIQTVDAILRLFRGHVDQIYFSHDSASPDVESYCGVIFSIHK